MHGNELVVGGIADKGKVVWKTKLQSHYPRHYKTYHSDGYRGCRILNSNDFSVLTEDVFRHPTLWMV